MRRSRIPTTLALTLVAGLVACKRGEPSGESDRKTACDQPALAALAKQLDAATPEARVLLVAEGLLEACSGSLYPTTEFYLREVATPSPDARAAGLSPTSDPGFAAAKQRVCPNEAALAAQLTAAAVADYGRVAFEVCEFGRYDVIDVSDASGASELDPVGGVAWLTWTTHEQLLADGTPPEVAKSISRAVLLFERVTFGVTSIAPLAGQRLPKLVGSPLFEGVVISASARELVVHERTLAVLSDGELVPAAVSNHLVGTLYEALSEEAEKSRAIAESRDEDWVGRGLLALDGRLRFASVVDILYTAGRAGFTEYGLVVEPSYPVKQAIYIKPPKFDHTAGYRPQVRVFISDEGYRVVEPGNPEPRMIAKLDADAEGPEGWNRARLRELAQARHDQQPELTTAVVSADYHVRHEVVVATYAALLGDGCEQQRREGCLFPDLIIEAGAG